MQRGAFCDSLVGSTLLSILPPLKGNEIVLLLLENGADVNSRNYCGSFYIWVSYLENGKVSDINTRQNGIASGYYVNAKNTPIIFRWIPHATLIRWALHQRVSRSSNLLIKKCT